MKMSNVKRAAELAEALVDLKKEIGGLGHVEESRAGFDDDTFVPKDVFAVMVEAGMAYARAELKKLGVTEVPDDGASK